MKYAGFYINLDRSPERRKSIEEELARHGLGGRYTRFAATDGNALHFPNPKLLENEIGCFTSHYRVMMENKDHPRPLHVIEDDIILSPVMEIMLDQLIECGDLAKYDIVYTDVNIPVSSNQWANYKACYNSSVKHDKTGEVESAIFNIIDMRRMDLASTCSMLINPQSIVNLAELYEYELTHGARMPIDLFIRSLCDNDALRVGCLFPFVTSIRPENYLETTIHNRADVKTIHANHMLRHSFYVGCNLAQSLEQASRIYPQPESSDLHGQLMQRLLGFALTPGHGKS